MRTLNILLVDDEPEACINLKNILLDYIDENINIVDVAHSTRDAELKIAQYKPNAVFLDISMPNENAFQFLERLDRIDFEIVFVTAYDEYAVRAFKLNAVDYILKPINIEDLKNATDKLKEKIFYKNIRLHASTITDLSQQIIGKKKQLQIILKDNNRIETVAFKQIHYFKAMGSYSTVYYSQDREEKSFLMSRPISEYEELVPHNIFFRIHRSYLVNCSCIKKIVREDTPLLILQNGTVLPIGRRRFAALLVFLEDFNLPDA